MCAKKTLFSVVFRKFDDSFGEYERDREVHCHWVSAYF